MKRFVTWVMSNAKAVCQRIRRFENSEEEAFECGNAVATLAHDCGLLEAATVLPAATEVAKKHLSSGCLTAFGGQFHKLVAWVLPFLKAHHVTLAANLLAQMVAMPLPALGVMVAGFLLAAAVVALISLIRSGRRKALEKTIESLRQEIKNLKDVFGRWSPDPAPA